MWRAGAHTSGEYRSGLTLSHASRLLSSAHGGQILVSSAAQEMLRDDVLREGELRDLGSHRLRDLARAEHVFQVIKSLVVMDDRGGESRYRMLETIRQYASEKLAAAGDSEAVRARHRDFYLGFAEKAASELQGREQVAWLARLEADHDNLRAALRWCIERNEMEPALRLGAALWRFWDTRGYVREGREWLDELLTLGEAASGSMGPAARRALASVLDGSARMRLRASEFSQTIELHRRARLRAARRASVSNVTRPVSI